MNILSIGGSDPSSGAGVQGDIRVISELGAHCVNVVTAVTSQNTSSYMATHVLPVKSVRTQIASVIDDFEIDAVKVGMLYSAPMVRCIADALGRIDAPVIVDPVIKSTTGGVLLQRSALGAFRTRIIPLTDAITPNLSEAEMLAGVRGASASARSILRRGSKSVIITGIRRGQSVCDHVFAPQKQTVCAKTRSYENHGGGCAHSAAVAFAMAQGHDIMHAAKFARRFIDSHMGRADNVGAGVAITGVRDTRYTAELYDAITAFVVMPDAHDLIPECQTNFVLAPPEARAIPDILGVRGRIVRSGSRVLVAGDIVHGGSQHVASALAAMRIKFPAVRSCINIRHSRKTISRMRRLGMTVAHYDRSHEPKSHSQVEGRSVRWGVRSAISRLRAAPDAVYHDGAQGKEPMILIFGLDAADVLQKVRQVSAST